MQYQAFGIEPSPALGMSVQAAQRACATGFFNLELLFGAAQFVTQRTQRGLGSGVGLLDAGQPLSQLFVAGLSLLATQAGGVQKGLPAGYIGGSACGLCRPALFFGP